jgi:zona occludens toxin
MSIRVITGLPGAGKTLRAVDAIRKALAAGRNVYCDGIDGLQPFGWESCDLNKWEDLPDGSLVVADEAQKRWPTRRSGEPPAHIAALSEHRHRGFDFILLTQHPTMLDSYVRKLVDTHEHLVRQFKSKVARVYAWQECYDDPQSLATRQRSESSLWKYPPECFPLYKSATLHTVQAKIPKRLLAIPVLLAIAAVLVFFGVRAVRSMASKPDVPAAVVDAHSSASVPFKSAEDYVAKFTPRVQGMPWSSPAFDDRKVKSEPEIYCVSIEFQSCRCYSEQITPIEVNQTACREIARHGVYNPFRDPRSLQAQSAQPAPSADSKNPRVIKSQMGSAAVGDSGVPEASAGRDLKVSAGDGGASSDWGRPDFSYKVPFPSNRGRR